MPIMFRAYMGDEALETERRSIAFSEQGDWVRALTVWLGMVRRYPHEDAPLHAFTGQFSHCAVMLQEGLPRFTALPGRRAPEDALVLEHLQDHLSERLHALARRRGIHVWRRRNVRARRLVLRGLVSLPWEGPSRGATYHQALVPSRQAAPPPGSRWHGRRWHFPGFVIKVRRELAQWEPFTLATLLGMHMVAQRQRHRRSAIIARGLNAAMERPPKERLAAMWAVRAETAPLLTPNEASNLPEAGQRAERIGNALLVYLLRLELRRMQAAEQTT
jgi:hypothetical protein